MPCLCSNFQALSDRVDNARCRERTHVSCLMVWALALPPLLTPPIGMPALSIAAAGVEF